MVMRRRVLQGLGALPFLPVIDQAQEKIALSGTVTNSTGSVNGNSLTGLQGAYTGNFGGVVGVSAWQHVCLLSDNADPCGTGNPYVGNELTVRLVLWTPDVAPVYPPSGDLPLTFTVPDVQLITSDGFHRAVRAYFMKAKANGSAGGDVAATGGTVTFTAMDSTTYDGDYDLTFPNGGSAAGSFTAPWCGTAP
jgi:hypothetical protein